MRISDWSSDVCSSDLIAKDLHAGRVAGQDHGVGLMCEQCCAGGFTFEFKECGLAAFGYAVGAEQCHRQHLRAAARSEEHTSELQSLMRISYAVFCLKKTKTRPKYPIKQ